jgi:hypothetical protein
MPRRILRIAIRPFLYEGTVVILLMFLFEQQVDGALGLVGYDRNIVSYFAIVRSIHSRFVLYYDGAANLDPAHFHMLDLVLLLSIVVWGTWLTTGIICLNKYDQDLRLFSTRVLDRFRGRRLFLCFSWMFVLSSPIILSITPRIPLVNPEMHFILDHIPKVYFFAVALSYWIGGFLFGLSILLIVWKVWRSA